MQLVLFLAVTKYPYLNGLKQHIFILLQSWKSGIQNESYNQDVSRYRREESDSLPLLASIGYLHLSSMAPSSIFRVCYFNLSCHCHISFF